MKERYDKPPVGNERVFKLTSQARGVKRPSSGYGADGFRYEEFCDLAYMIRNAECPEPGWPPVALS